MQMIFFPLISKQCWITAASGLRLFAIINIGSVPQRMEGQASTDCCLLWCFGGYFNSKQLFQQAQQASTSFQSLCSADYH